MKHTTTILAAVLVTALSPSCERPGPGSMDQSTLSRWIGEHVQIQFRRDALGTAANLPVNPVTNSINGAETSIAGKLINITPDAVLLESAGRVRWIPREVILLIDANESVSEKQ